MLIAAEDFGDSAQDPSDWTSGSLRVLDAVECLLSLCGVILYRFVAFFGAHALPPLCSLHLAYPLGRCLKTAVTVFAEDGRIREFRAMKICVDAICNLLKWWQSKLHLLAAFERNLRHQEVRDGI